MISSAVERLVYTERVGGSIPSSPTIFQKKAVNNLFSLILAVVFLAGCGRKSDPTPETKDSYPRTYPKEDVVISDGK